MPITKDGLFQKEYNVAGSIRVALEDTSGAAAPSKLHSDITTIITYFSDGTDASPVITAGDWHERGYGIYDIDMTAAEMANIVGETTIYLLVSGCKPRWVHFLVTEETSSDRVENAITAIGVNLTAIQAIQNNTSTNFLVPISIYRKAIGDAIYRFPFYLYDSVGNPEAPDSAPTITIKNLAGTVLVNGVSMTQDGAKVGVYYYDYTVSDTDTLQKLIVEAAVTEGTVTRYVPRPTEVFDEMVQDVIQAGCAAALSGFDAAKETSVENAITAAISSITGGDLTIGSLSSQISSLYDLTTFTNTKVACPSIIYKPKTGTTKVLFYVEYSNDVGQVAPDSTPIIEVWTPDNGAILYENMSQDGEKTGSFEYIWDFPYTITDKGALVWIHAAFDGVENNQMRAIPISEEPITEEDIASEILETDLTSHDTANSVGRMLGTHIWNLVTGFYGNWKTTDSGKGFSIKDVVDGVTMALYQNLDEDEMETEVDPIERRPVSGSTYAELHTK